MLEDVFEELTLERGETINILGMTVHMDRANKRGHYLPEEVRGEAGRDLQSF